jgi:hypothetical protein
MAGNTTPEVSASPSSPVSPQILSLPAHVRAGQVLGLVEIIGGLGTAVDASKLADEFGEDLVTFLPILDTGEMLGLVKVEKGDISLTEFGLKFQRTSKYKVRLVKDQLAGIEPFKTAIELAGNKGGVTAADVAQDLWDRGIRWHHSPELNETLVQTLLIHWAIYAGLLSYGKAGIFQKV